MPERDGRNIGRIARTVPILGNGLRFICRGSDGIAQEHWSYGTAPPRGAAPADEWERLCDAAHTAKHAEVNANYLESRMIGEAFVDSVIGDPKVQACGEWLCSEYPEFRCLFSEGVFPSTVANSSYGPWLIVDGDKWPVILDAVELSWNFARVASRGECHD
jgi:hypothetical protein